MKFKFFFFYTWKRFLKIGWFPGGLVAISFLSFSNFFKRTRDFEPWAAWPRNRKPTTRPERLLFDHEWKTHFLVDSVLIDARKFLLQILFLDVDRRSQILLLCQPYCKSIQNKRPATVFSTLQGFIHIFFMNVADTDLEPKGPEWFSPDFEHIGIWICTRIP